MKYIVRPQVNKTRKVNAFYYKMVIASGCPHCKSSLDEKQHSIFGGKVGICNNASCLARTVYKAYYYVSETCERVFKYFQLAA